jgi:hypothetical protein
MTAIGTTFARLLNGCHHHTLVAIEVRVGGSHRGPVGEGPAAAPGGPAAERRGSGMVKRWSEAAGAWSPIGYLDGKTTLFFACVYGESQTIGSHHLLDVSWYM